MLALGMSEWPNDSGFGKLHTKLLPQLLSGRDQSAITQTRHSNRMDRVPYIITLVSSI